MTIAADTHIVLDAHSPKKDATVGQLAPTVGNDDVAIWANGVANAELTQTIVGAFHKLHRYQYSVLKNATGAVTYAIPLDGGDGDITALAPTSGQVGLYIGANLAAGDKSHFIDRTFKRLIERWLELAKTGSGATPSAARITSVGNDHTFSGFFPGLTMVKAYLKVTDPDGDEDIREIDIELPDIDPPGHPPEVAASVVCARIDSLVHIRCDLVGKVLSLSAAAPANTLESRVYIA